MIILQNAPKVKEYLSFLLFKAVINCYNIYNPIEGEIKMSGYKVSEVTKSKIISVARKLFYEKGYVKTTYSEICGEAGVNEGTLHYQYGSKANLGKAINADMVRRNIDEAKALMGDAADEKDMALYALFNYVFWYKFFADEKYRRFSHEIAQEYRAGDIDEYYGTYFPFKWIAEGLYHDDEKMLRLCQVSCFSIDRGIPSYLMKHIDEYSYDDIAAYCVNLYADLLGYNRSMAFSASMKAGKIMKSSDLSFLNTRLE